MKRISPRGRLRRTAVLALLCVAAGSGCNQRLLDNETDEGMVYYGPTSRIRGFDPVRAGDVSSSLGIGKINEGLLQYSYLYRPYRVEPLLAEALPEVSEDGLLYRFRIRKGIYFQDDPCFEATGGKGRELRSEDFIYTIKRVADIKTASNGFWAFNDRIVGLNDFRAASAGEAPTDYDMAVDGLLAPDPYTLEIRLTRPYPQLQWILTMHYSYALAREALEYYGKEYVNHPVGTGPYILASWQRNYRVEFVRNPKWAETGREEFYPTEGEPGDQELGLLDAAGMPIPFFDRIVQFVVQDPATDWLMFLNGQFASSGISRDNWDAVITDQLGLDDRLAEKGIHLSTMPTLQLYYTGFNMEDPVVGESDDPVIDRKHRKLRQAMSCALNTEEWIRFYNGRITRPNGPIPPGVAGYNDRENPYDFNLKKARRLLEEAGYPEGTDPATGRRLQLSLELGSAESAEMRQAMELLASFMEEIGVVLKPSYNNWPTFLDKMDRRQAQMFRLGWVADYPDAENFLQLFYSKNASPGPNHANYTNEDFDRLYEKVRVMQDTPERTALYTEMADIVIEDCPWIFDQIPLSYALHHAWIRNYKPHDFPYGVIKYHAVDQDLRQAWMRKYVD